MGQTEQGLDLGEGLEPGVFEMISVLTLLV